MSNIAEQPDQIDTEYTYVVLTIDLASSLDGEVDQEALEAWEKMKPQSYVGLSDFVNFWDCEDYHPLKRFKMFFVLQGPLLSSRKHYITDAMTIPITPETYAHPDGRQPLSLSSPFPWADCYHASSLYTDVLCSPTVATTPSTCRIADDDQRKFFTIEHDDNHVGMVAEFEAEENGLPDPEDTPEELRLPYAEAVEHAQKEIVPIVKISSDLSLVDCPGDPRRFFEEVAYVEQLRKEILDRKRRETEKRDAEAFSVPASLLHKSKSAEESSSRSPSQDPYRWTFCAPVASRTISILRLVKTLGQSLLCRPNASDN